MARDEVGKLDGGRDAICKAGCVFSVIEIRVVKG
jgi:hypothetical protein